MSAFRNLRLIPAWTGASKSNTILQCRMSPARAVKTGKTAWSVGDGKNFAPSTESFMVNYRVSDLHGLLAALRAEGCDVLEKTEESEFGKFAGVMDPEGNKVELWQPPEGQ
jgi:predicted enzyme related to lactoylglutathione lyase